MHIDFVFDSRHGVGEKAYNEGVKRYSYVEFVDVKSMSGLFREVHNSGFLMALLDAPSPYNGIELDG